MSTTYRLPPWAHPRNANTRNKATDKGQISTLAPKKKKSIQIDNESQNFQTNKHSRATGITTMSGLPMSVRNNPLGQMKYPEKRIPPVLRPRFGTYSYIYDFNTERSRTAPNTPQNLLKPRLQDQDLEHHVQQFIDSKSEAHYSLAHTGYSPSLQRLMEETGNHPMDENEIDLNQVWRKIQRQNEEKEDAESVHQSESVTPSELLEAANAFNFPIPSTSAKPLKTLKKVQLQEPTPPEKPAEIYQPSYKVLPQNQEKLIEDQVKKEFLARKLPPLGNEYIKRLQDLRRAALMERDNEKDKPTGVIFPNLIDAYNYQDLFRSHGGETQFEILRRKNNPDSVPNPKLQIQTLSPPILTQIDNMKLRQEHKKSLIETVLREIDEQKRTNLRNVEDKIEEPRKRTKDQEKSRQMALRALENYRAVQDRQKRFIHRVPQVTVGHGKDTPIPRESEFHQMAMNYMYRNHKPQNNNVNPTVYHRDLLAKILRDKSQGMNMKTMPKYPAYATNTSVGLPPPPPPISEPFISQNKKKKKAVMKKQERMVENPVFQKIETRESSDSFIN